jgi:hypothetical protein
MDFDAAFAVQRPLGGGADGGYLPFQALTAIHVAHRLGAAVLLPAMALLAWKLHRQGGSLRPVGPCAGRHRPLAGGERPVQRAPRLATARRRRAHRRQRGAGRSP